MRKLAFLLLCSLTISAPLFSQENPKIDKETIISRAHDDAENAQKLLITAEKYYKKGTGYYGEALKYYLRLYQYAPDLSQLNYKIGVCCLYSSNQKKALQYLVRSYPDVTSDYYYQLGKAYQYDLQYDNAKAAYDSYYKTLSKCKKRSKSKELNQLKKECAFGAKAVKDSVPVFIVNLGPVINSFYDDYGAVLSTKGDSAIFFTSRRPRREPSKIKPRDKYPERILVTNNCLSRPSEEVTEPRQLKSHINTAVSGLYQKGNRLFFYRGKFQNGNIHSAQVQGRYLDDIRMLRGRINKIAYKETSISIAPDSTVYFVSNRPGGVGGKDIWECKWNGKNRYKKPVNLGRRINTPFDEEGVCVSDDGKTLYFSSNGLNGMGGFDVFKSEKQANNTWGPPVNMGYPINSPANELFYHPTADSMVALYATTRDGGFGGLDIHKIQKDPRIPFELFGRVIDNKDSSILAASISVFNMKTNEVVASTLQDTTTGNYNISFEDVGPYLTQVDAPGYKSVTDTLKLPTKRHDKLEANYQLEKLKYPFTLFGNVFDIKTGLPIQADITFKPVNDTIVSNRTASNSKTGNYTITFADKQSFEMDVNAKNYYPYHQVLELKKNRRDNARLDIALKPSIVTYVMTGYIFEQGTENKLDGTVTFSRPGEDQPVAVSESDSTGKYTISVDETGPFVVEVNSEGYFFLNGVQEFNADTTLAVRNFELKKMKTGAKIVVHNILFNSGKSTLKSSSYSELNRLANLLIENKNVKIEVSGHTDNVGSASLNKRLSKARALAVRNYLISKGVEEERVSYQGYGFEQPIADNSTAEGRAQNRRVEIKVVE